MDKPTGVGRSAVHSHTAEEPEHRDPATRSQVTTTKVGLALPAGLSYEQWEHTGRQLAGVLSSSSWWLGDWLLFGREQLFPTAEAGFYFSGVTYTTLGYGDLVLPVPWRMLGPIEGLTGILMCGLSAGVFFATLNRIYMGKWGGTHDADA